MIKTSVKICSFALICLFYPKAALAGIEWVAKEITPDILPGADVVPFSFNFKNCGNNIVTIEEVKASCSCTLVELKTRTLAPQASGIIQGAYKVNGQLGSQSVRLHFKAYEVINDIHKPLDETLKLNIVVSPAIKITPTVNIWRKGGLCNKKTIKFEVDPRIVMPLHLIEIKEGDFEKEWNEVDAGRTYELKVTPRSTAQETTSTIVLSGKNETGLELKFYAYLLVR